MSNPIDNCAVIAIAALTGEAPEHIAADIAAFPDERGGPAFVGDSVKTYSLGSFLESRGWTTLYRGDRPTIPWTCVVGLPGHVFAVVDGVIHDRAWDASCGEPIMEIWTPPDPRRTSDPVTGGGRVETSEAIERRPAAKTPSHKRLPRSNFPGENR